MAFSFFSTSTMPTTELTQPADKKKMIIFDLDGTLADTVKIIVETLNRYAKQLKVPEFKSYSDVLRLTSGLNALKFLGHRSQIAKDLLDTLERRVGEIHVFDGWKETLECFHSQGYVLGIHTQNRKKTAESILEQHNLREYFSFIVASDGEEKKPVGEYIKQYNGWAGHVFYVTDTRSDIELTRKDAKTIAVTWGYESKELLEEKKPHSFITHPKELVQVVAKHENIQPAPLRLP